MNRLPPPEGWCFRTTVIQLLLKIFLHFFAIKKATYLYVLLSSTIYWKNREI